MIFSILILRTRYTYRHVIGVLLCIAGIAASVGHDLAAVFSCGPAPSPDPINPQCHLVLGDFLVLLSSTTYALANVL